MLRGRGKIAVFAELSPNEMMWDANNKIIAHVALETISPNVHYLCINLEAHNVLPENRQ